MSSDRGPGYTRPSIAELREVAQPLDHMGRASGEHWAGRLYIRRASIYFTWLIIPTRISPNGVTWLFIAAGPIGAAALLIPGIAGALLTAIMMQVQGLLDCSDGELARWRRQFSAAGIYLDRIGHYLTEAALPIFLGIRAGGGWGEFNGWTTLGCLIAVGHLINKAETDLVHVSRALTGLPKVQDQTSVAAPQAGAARSLRSLVRFVPFYRTFVSIEFSLLVLAAAIVDAFIGSLWATQALVVLMIPTVIIIAVGHLYAVLNSNRLK